MKIVSVVKDGKRVDMPIDKFQKMLEETKATMEKVEEKKEEK